MIYVHLSAERISYLNCPRVYDWTGRTEKEDVALVANFTFVARDSETKKAAPVNQLVPETEEEKRLYAQAEARNELKKRQRKQGNGDVSKEAIDMQRLKDILSEVGGIISIRQIVSLFAARFYCRSVESCDL